MNELFADQKQPAHATLELTPEQAKRLSFEWAVVQWIKSNPEALACVRGETSPQNDIERAAITCGLPPRIGPFRVVIGGEFIIVGNRNVREFLPLHSHISAVRAVGRQYKSYVEVVSVEEWRAVCESIRISFNEGLLK